jgi:hypothetical protein
MNIKFSRQIFGKVFEIKYFMEIHTVEDKFFLRKYRQKDSSADRQMESHDKAYNRFSQFWERA